MRFVVPETKRIELGNGDWIEIKKELTKAEDAAFRTRAMKARMQPGGADGGMTIDIDWKILAIARVEAYLLDWSAKEDNGKDKPVSPTAIGALATADFDAIDAAIQTHITELDEEKKAQSGKPL